MADNRFPNPEAADAARAAHVQAKDRIDRQTVGIDRALEADNEALMKARQEANGLFGSSAAQKEEGRLSAKIERETLMIARNTMMGAVELSESLDYVGGKGLLQEMRTRNAKAPRSEQLPDKVFQQAANEIARIHALEVGTEQKSPASTPAKEKPAAQGVYRI